MNPFARFAFFTIARDASFVTLAAATLMVAFSFEPPLAFKIGATVALIFSIGLVVRSFSSPRSACCAVRSGERCDRTSAPPVSKAGSWRAPS